MTSTLKRNGGRSWTGWFIVVEICCYITTKRLNWNPQQILKNWLNRFLWRYSPAVTRVSGKLTQNEMLTLDGVAVSCCLLWFILGFFKKTCFMEFQSYYYGYHDCSLNLSSALTGFLWWIGKPRQTIIILIILFVGYKKKAFKKENSFTKTFENVKKCCKITKRYTEDLSHISYTWVKSYNKLLNILFCRDSII